MNKFFFILFLPLFIGCFSKKEEPKKESAPKQNAVTTVSLTDAQIKNAGIVTGKPVMRSIEAVLKVNGLIDVPPQNMVTVSFPSGGYLKSTHLLPGMKISKGQVIGVMQDQSFVQMQEDYLMAVAKLSFLQKEYERQKLLNTTKATSDKIYEQTASDYQSVRITVKALQQKLLLLGINPSTLNESTISRTVNIYAPISGYVAAVNVNIGKYVNPTDVLFELVNPKDLHLVLTVFEKDLRSIHTGQKVKVYLTSDTTKTYNAEVLLVSKTLDSNRSATVHCHFDGATPPLLPGMFVNADIQVTNNTAITVPEEAVVRSGDKEYIFIERKNKQFEMMPVNTAVSQSGLVSISSTDTDMLNQVIIIKNAYAALMKMKNTGEEE
ncbi:efflux RND transporter periplasmic adaptor subunit [Segetibacter koreensis]|uniref:efflux RND transporter periplasmic adaptor subunit n=1 Tax=Segetibacter koreensis TaxID=398037 RepID=UPI0003A5F3FF|nr:efflux RND transporter periplasmic adaptor subunit [Segetibacter koreensis]